MLCSITIHGFLNHLNARGIYDTHLLSRFNKRETVALFHRNTLLVHIEDSVSQSTSLANNRNGPVPHGIHLYVIHSIFRLRTQNKLGACILQRSLRGWGVESACQLQRGLILKFRHCSKIQTDLGQTTRLEDRWYHEYVSRSVNVVRKGLFTSQNKSHMRMALELVCKLVELFLRRKRQFYCSTNGENFHNIRGQ